MSKLTSVVTGIPTLWLVKISSGQYNKFSNPTDRMSHGKPTARTISPPTRGPATYFKFRNYCRLTLRELGGPTLPTTNTHLHLRTSFIHLHLHNESPCNPCYCYQSSSFLVHQVAFSSCFPTKILYAFLSRGLEF
jgi:hypothetical protein